MNYRHAYHAGNFADVVKHIILSRVIAYFKRKDAPFFLLDTHAGIGRYDLTSIEAQKTLEFEQGIAKFWASESTAPDEIKALTAPFTTIIKDLNMGGDLTQYPGSPLIAYFSMRRDDRLSMCELHEEDFESLALEFKRAKGTKAHHLDAWIALKAQVPPKEKRGIVLIDPPFEKRDEFDAILTGIKEAHKRFATGTYMIWYPIKDIALTRRFAQEITLLDLDHTLDVHLMIDQPSDEAKFIGTGMIIINPPYTLKQELTVLLPWLSKLFEVSPGAGSFTIDTLVDEK